MKRAVLALADGSIFEGVSFGATGETVGEVVFNTSMFGYQEILTDPSYVGQIVAMAYPQMGNVGVNPEDEESFKPHAVGMIAREVHGPSNWRSTESLDAYLKKHNICGIERIDTRKLVRHLRDHGSQMGVVSTENLSKNALVDRARSAPSMEGLDLATGISTNKTYIWEQPTPAFLVKPASTVALTKNVVAIDYGLKKAMLQYLVDVGCRVTVVPSSHSADQILKMKPDGVFLTNGPGDPAAVKGAESTVRAMLGKVPIFGICLGHQILARAAGASTYKMKFGHRGANQPVKDLVTSRVEITAQNHGFAVDGKTMAKDTVVSHVNLNDGSVEGVMLKEAKAFSVQYHPESSPGPHDANYLFHRFAELMAR